VQKVRIKSNLLGSHAKKLKKRKIERGDGGHTTWSRFPSSSWVAMEFTREAPAERREDAAVDAPEDMIRM
jgi:hypothetical protein